MRIVIPSVQVPFISGGSILMTNGLANALKQAGHEVRVIRPEAYFGKIKPGRNGLGKWLGYIDKFIIFPFLKFHRN